MTERHRHQLLDGIQHRSRCSIRSKNSCRYGNSDSVSNLITVLCRKSDEFGRVDTYFEGKFIRRAARRNLHIPSKFVGLKKILAT